MDEEDSATLSTKHPLGDIGRPGSGYPPLSVLAVATLEKGGSCEYRVGIVTEEDFVAGLRLDDGSLNPKVAHRCFGGSVVYADSGKAEQAARQLYERTYDEVFNKYLGRRAERLAERSNTGGDVAEYQAAVDASKRVCGVKVLHFCHPWPP
jgi:hypothetical protein